MLLSLGVATWGGLMVLFVAPIFLLAEGNSCVPQQGSTRVSQPMRGGGCVLDRKCLETRYGKWQGNALFSVHERMASYGTTGHAVYRTMGGSQV